MNNQEIAFEKLSKLKVGALFMEMGTGKTKVALDLIASKKDKVNYILWICPFSIKQEIEQERLKWHPELKIDIIGVETISQSSKEYLRVFNKVIESKSFIVVDESLKIKNMSAKRTKRILKLGSYAKYKLILNGTPLSKNILDLYPQMEFLSPKILNMSITQFRNQYCEYYLQGRLKNKVKKQYNIEHLVSLIKPYIFDSKLDLGKDKTYHKINYSIEDLEEYENIKHNFLGFDNDMAFFSLVTLLQKHYCTQKSRLELIRKTIDSIDGQVIVFVKYLDSIPSEETHKIIGEMNDSKRDIIIQGFREGKFKTLYITYGCGSFGLNLQNCRNIIFADHTFDYSQRIQAEARIFRIGQEYDVNYYDMNCNCGLDKLIRGCLNKKVKLLDEVKEEIEKKGVEEWLKTI
mgnify:CR=1 FL=1